MPSPQPLPVHFRPDSNVRALCGAISLKSRIALTKDSRAVTCENCKRRLDQKRHAKTIERYRD